MCRDTFKCQAHIIGKQYKPSKYKNGSEFTCM